MRRLTSPAMMAVCALTLSASVAAAASPPAMDNNRIVATNDQAVEVARHGRYMSAYKTSPYFWLVSSSTASTPVFTAAERAAAIRAIEDAINRTYVFPDLKPAIIAKLDQSEQAGRYDTTDPAVFADRITEDLKAVAHDGHLYLKDDRDAYAAAIAPQTSIEGQDAYTRLKAIGDHHGLAALEILPGNIRYLRISAFDWVPGSTAGVYDDALRFLKDGDAIVIDLRDNGGGDADATGYLLDAIMHPGVPLFIHRDGAVVTRSISHAHPPGGSLEGKPLYVLVDGHTGSGAEAFAYAVQQQKVGTIVGETTFGAANNNKKFPIAPQFILSVSYARPLSAVTGTNWEGVGVKPDIASPGVKALSAAELAALDFLAGSHAKADALAQYRWARVAALAEIHPLTVDSAHLQALAGTYGPVTVHLDGADLRLTRTDRPKWLREIRLRPLTQDGLFAAEAFAFDDLRVRLTGSTLEFFYGSDDSRETFARTN